MGQQNQIVEFQQADNENDRQTQKRKGIFKQSYNVNASAVEHCSLPDCKCPGKKKNGQQQSQQKKDLKICSVCNNDIKNFRKNEKTHYESGKFKIVRPQKEPFSKSSYEVKQTMDYEPKVLYFNAWSPPTQRCFVQLNAKELSETHHTEIENNSSHGEPGGHPGGFYPHHDSDRNESPVPNIEPPFDYDVDPRDRYQNFLMIKGSRY